MDIKDQTMSQILDRTDIIKLPNNFTTGHFFSGSLYLITFIHVDQCLFVTSIPDLSNYDEMRKDHSTFNSNDYPYLLLNPNESGYERVLVIKKDEELLRFETIIAPQLAHNDFQIKYNY